MAELDPIVPRQFGWLDAVSLDALMTDPDIAARLAESYVTDPDYRAPACDVEDRDIPGPDGSGTAVRIYSPTGADPTAALVWVHGGGFVAGSLDQPEADTVAREIATRAQALVVSVGYRLADGKDITYPALHHEVAAAFAWTRQHCHDLGIAPDDVQLGGASAGASLAFSTTLEALDDGAPLPARLHLIYPLLHRRIPDSDTSHMDVVPDALRLQQPRVEQMLAAYFGPSTEAPFFELGDRDPAQLPPTLVVVCEYDDLRPSGEQLVRRMEAAGGDVTAQLAEGMVHGHLNMSASHPQVERTLALMARHLRA